MSLNIVKLRNMTEEEKELLVSLLEKAQDEICLVIYDKDDNYYGIDWMYIGYDNLQKKNRVFLKIE